MKSLLNKIKFLTEPFFWYGLIGVSIANTITYNSYPAIVLNMFYLVNGYDVPAHVTDCHYYSENTYKVTLVDSTGKEYSIEGTSNQRSTKMYQELNQIGANNIIRRSYFLDRWDYWQRGKLRWELLLTDIVILIVFILCNLFIVILPIRSLLYPDKYGDYLK